MKKLIFLLLIIIPFVGMTQQEEYGNRKFINWRTDDTLNLSFQDSIIRFLSSDSVNIDKLTGYPITAGHTGDESIYSFNEDTVFLEPTHGTVYDNSEYEGTPKQVTFPRDTFITTIDESLFIYGEWNNGDPKLNTTTDRKFVNSSDKIPILTVFRMNNRTVAQGWSFMGQGLVERLNMRDIYANRFVHESGLTIDTLNNLNVQATSGTVWQSAKEFNLDAASSIADTMFYYWYDGTDWQHTDTATINTTQYNDETGLVEAGNNQYLARFFFTTICEDPNLVMVLGDQEYNQLSVALEADMPANLPNLATNFAVPIGRMIIQKNAGEVEDIASYFDKEFASSTVTNHGDLTGLGDPTDHLWALQWADTTDKIATKSDIPPGGSDDQTLSTDGTAGDISIENGNNITLNVDDADADATNEYNSGINWDNTNNDIEVTDGGGTLSATITGFLESESDPVFTGHLAYDITDSDTTYWGNHYTDSDIPADYMQEGENNSLLNNDAGYITSYTNNYVNSVSFNGSGNGILTLGRSGLGDLTEDLDGRYLQSYTETDPVYSADPAYNITDAGSGSVITSTERNHFTNTSNPHNTGLSNLNDYITESNITLQSANSYENLLIGAEFSSLYETDNASIYTTDGYTSGSSTGIGYGKLYIQGRKDSVNSQIYLRTYDNSNWNISVFDEKGNLDVDGTISENGYSVWNNNEITISDTTYWGNHFTNTDETDPIYNGDPASSITSSGSGSIITTTERTNLNTAYNERGSQIDGSNLSWDGSELDVTGVLTSTPNFQEVTNVDSITTNSISANSFYDETSNTQRILFPDDADLYKGGGSTGAIQVNLPSVKSMLTIKGTVFNYSSNTSFDFVASGYLYPNGPGWYNTTGIIIGDSPNTKEIRFAHSGDGSGFCILIGNTSTSWTELRVTIDKIVLGYSNINTYEFRNNIYISQVTSYPSTINKTISNAALANENWATLDNISSQGNSTSNDLYANDFILNSDRRLKKNINTFTDPMKALELNPVQFKWKESGANDIGFIAQDLLGKLPFMVKERSDGYYGISYGKITAVNNAAIQELWEQVKKQQDTIKAQQKRINKLSNKVNEIEKWLEENTSY